jgi:1-acyl-sn-glycerol-3-phosphate acyltransferase
VSARRESVLDKLPRSVHVWLGLLALFTTFAFGIGPFLALYQALGGDPDRRLAATITSWGFRGFLNWTLVTGFPRMRGLEHVRGAGPFVVVANHESDLDVCLVSAFSPRPTRLVSKAANKRVPLVAQAATAAGCLFAGGEEHSFLADATGAVRAGVSVAFFPEGTRSRGRGIRRFHKGAFEVAAETGAPILPLVIVGSGVFMPAGGINLLGPFRVTLEALAPRRIEGDRDEFRRALRSEMAAAHARILAEPFHEPSRRERSTIPAASPEAVES